MDIRHTLNEAKKKLIDAGISNPAIDVTCLFEKHTGIKRNDLRLLYDNTSPEELKGFWDDISRCCDGEPLQYILGEWEFYGLNFKVSKGVLIPRADTEVLVEICLEYLKNLSSPKVLELCVGSGCISVSIAVNNDACKVWGIDISSIALEYSQKNIDMNGVNNQVFVCKGNMLSDECEIQLPESFDLIVCNPPYISTKEVDMLDDSVKHYEPLIALDGGSDGLDFYKAFSLWLPLLKKSGMVAFEVGFDQSEQVVQILADNRLQNIFVKKDYAGNNRVVGGFK
jgi:release factor glutamine methyltransferase